MRKRSKTEKQYTHISIANRFIYSNSTQNLSQFIRKSILSIAWWIVCFLESLWVNMFHRVTISASNKTIFRVLSLVNRNILLANWTDFVAIMPKTYGASHNRSLVNIFRIASCGFFKVKHTRPAQQYWSQESCVGFGVIVHKVSKTRYP